MQLGEMVQTGYVNGVPELTSPLCILAVCELHNGPRSHVLMVQVSSSFPETAPPQMCENYRRNPVFHCFLMASHYKNDSTLKSTGDIEHLLCASSRLSIYQVI